MSDELKPCPFCGCKNIVIRKYTAVAGVHYYAQCDSANGGCGANIDSRTTKKSAVEAWNRRKEVRHGEWIKKEHWIPLPRDYEVSYDSDYDDCYDEKTHSWKEKHWHCSCCNYEASQDIKPVHKYCSHCGAKMDAE